MPLLIIKSGGDREQHADAYQTLDEHLLRNENTSDVLGLIYDRYRDVAKVFDDQPCQSITEGLVYVHQAECALVFPSDASVTFIGSDEATTCHIVVLIQKETGKTVLAHLDSDESIASHVRSVLKAFKVTAAQSDISRLNEPSTEAELPGIESFDVFVLGGYVDEANESVSRMSESFSRKFFRVLASRQETFYLKLACVSKLNTVKRSNSCLPRHYGAAVNVKTKKFSAATFPNKGPELVLRSCCRGPELKCVYDPVAERFLVSKAGYRPYREREIKALLQLDDGALLSLCSTSPLAEPPEFCQRTREQLRFMAATRSIDHLFPASGINRYKLNAQRTEWIKIEPDNQ